MQNNLYDNIFYKFVIANFFINKKILYGKCKWSFLF